MKKAPVILKSCINIACERSKEMFRGHEFFVGVNCVQSLIMFEQYFIQGKCFETAESYEQLNLSTD